MKDKPIVIFYKESLAQSIISDLGTFGLLGLCIWVSQGSTWWTLVTGIIFITYICGLLANTIQKGRRIYSTAELRKLADQIDKENHE